MYFVALCKDKAGMSDVRTANRAAHLAFLGAHAAQVKVAGPFLGDEGTMTGSMLILDCADEAEVQTLLAKDPYAHADIFESITVQPWRWVIGEPK